MIVVLRELTSRLPEFHTSLASLWRVLPVAGPREGGQVFSESHSKPTMETYESQVSGH